MTVFRRLASIKDHLLGIAVGTVFWCLLWGSFAPLSLVGGFLVAAGVFVVFPLPPLSREVTLRPWHALVFLIVFFKDLTVSSATVAWYALRPAGSPASSVIAVRLRSRSDLFLTFTGILATLIPGSVVVEAQRSTGTLFFHVIGAESQASVEAIRCSILAQEERVLRAFASQAVLSGAGLGPRGGAPEAHARHGESPESPRAGGASWA